MKKGCSNESDSNEKKIQQKKKNKKWCRICPELTFESEDQYFLHIKNQHDGKPTNYHVCYVCGRQVKTKSELIHHINSKCGTVKLYNCKECGQELMTAGSLHNHMLRHAGVRKYMCRFCAKLFLTAGQLKVHERIHTFDKAFVCEICGKGFCHRQSLITHSTLHTGIKPFQCDNCGDSFSCIGNLLKHRKTHAHTCGLLPLTTHRVKHPATKLKVKINTPANSRLKTVEREKKLKERFEALEKDKTTTENTTACRKEASDGSTERLKKVKTDIKQETNTENEKGDCKKCLEDASLDLTNSSLHKQSENFEDGSSMCSDSLTKLLSNSCECEIIEEESPANKDTDVAVVEKKWHEADQAFSCRFCQKMYTNPNSLNRHEKLHQINEASDLKELPHKRNVFKCSCCKASFDSKSDCVAHQHDDHADVLTCFDCDKIFANPDSLRSHQNTMHRGQRRKTYTYICDKCGKQFKQRLLLRYHGENNCGTGPQFQCQVCGKHFASIHTRRAHMRVHDSEKKLLCRFCGKSFHWKGQLKIHERRHTGEKPFNCLYCPKAFAYRESLITHSSLHTGIKPHLCEACGSRFSCVSNLSKHRVTHADTCGAWYKGCSQ